MNFDTNLEVTISAGQFYELLKCEAIFEILTKARAECPDDYDFRKVVDIVIPAPAKGGVVFA